MLVRSICPAACKPAPSCLTVFRLVSPAYRAWWDASPSRSGLLSSGCTASGRRTMHRTVGRAGRYGQEQRAAKQTPPKQQPAHAPIPGLLSRCPHDITGCHAQLQCTCSCGCPLLCTCSCGCAHLPAWARPAAAGASRHPAPRPAHVLRTTRMRPASRAARWRQQPGGAAPAAAPQHGSPAQHNRGVSSGKDDRVQGAWICSAPHAGLQAGSSQRTAGHAHSLTFSEPLHAW